MTSMRRSKPISPPAAKYLHAGFTELSSPGAGSENHVDLANGLVQLPRAAPAAREHGDVARPERGRLPAVRRDGQRAGQHVDDLVLLLHPVRRAGGALPDARLRARVVRRGPDGQAADGHRDVGRGRLLKRPPVLKVGRGRGGEEGGVDDGRGIGHGKDAFSGRWCRGNAARNQNGPPNEGVALWNDTADLGKAAIRTRAGLAVTPAS